MDKPAIEKLARLIRYYILEITHKAGSGHPTSSLSAVELMTMLYFKYLRFDFDNPDNPANDRVIFSKGHASALLYSLYGAAGNLTEEELLGYRTFNSVLEGHPTNRFRYTEFAGGSLGQGLSVGAGEAFALKNQKVNSHVWVLLGDGELAEGSVWEAANWAGFRKLDNLIAVVDVNRLGQAGPTMWQYDTAAYERRFAAFGWAVLVIDGHDFTQIEAAYQKAMQHVGSPSVIIAKTVKGKGVLYWENKEGFHNKMLPPEELTRALGQFGSDKEVRGTIMKPADNPVVLPVKSGNPQDPLYDAKAQIATTQAFGTALVRLGKAHQNLFVLDGDMANSTHTDEFAKAFPNRFLEMYIAEQNMIGVSVGLARRGYKPFVSTFSSFLASRAHDQLRIAPLSGVSIRVNGAYGGVSMGKDGPSQMGLEDIAVMRAIYGSTVLYPCDPYETDRLVESMLGIDGVSYIRTTREPLPILYSEKDEFPVGGSKTFDSPNAKVTVIAAGITVHEALKAQKQVAGICVIDCYSIKPIDVATLKKAAEGSKAIIVVEDHYVEGGLGDAVRSALSDKPKVPIIHLAVTKIPRSGKPEELLAYEEIDAKAIINAVSMI